MADDRISLRCKAQSQLKSFLADCRVEAVKGKKVLEIGFKNGLFLDECHNAGLDAAGLEINRQYFDTVQQDFPHLKLFHYDGGRFPVDDGSVDFVVSFQVLEHVDSTEQIIQECLRVLKSGGIMYHVCPNYHSFYEGHYNLLWLPFLSKKTGRWYLKLLRRYAPNFEQLNLIRPAEARAVLGRYGSELETISLGKKEFIARFSPEQIEKVGNTFLRNVLKVVFCVPGLKHAFLGFACWAEFYYPMTVICKKIPRDK